MGMDLGQYLCGLYNLDGELRMREFLDARVLMPGLRLAIGFLDDAVFIPPEPLAPDRASSSTFHSMWNY
jgi:hypothetical protein